jgi:putative ABC transport system permease protein
VSALDRKLLRDLSRLRGQVITIALVVAAGIAAFVTLQSAWASLERARDTYYDRYRFGDVFATAERVPGPTAAEIEAIPGVAVVYPRIVEWVTVPIEGLAEPASGRLVSLPSSEPAPLNALYLRAGRMPAPGRQDEVVVLDAFATAHGLEPGSAVPVVINGTLRKLRIVGIGLSPEFVFAASPTDFVADAKRVAVLWMDHELLAAAFRVEGAFNDVVLRLQPGASHPAVRAELDRILEPYGGLGAVSRDRQTSHSMLNGELSQLERFATVVPFIFLAVAAFLLNVVLSRLVGLQRQQIAVLAAVGYGGRRIALHFVELAAVIVVVGALVGAVAGWWLGGMMVDLYRQYFRFPELRHQVGFGTFATGVLASLIAGLGGAAITVRSIVRLSPAEAMRPPSPPTYRVSWLERLGVGALLGPSTTMVIRELRRRPLRLLASSLGVAAAIGLLIVGRFGYDSFSYLVERVMHQETRASTSVTFFDPVPERAVRELAAIPGVLDAEGVRVVPVRVRAGARFRDSSIQGVPDEARLRRVVSRRAEVVELGPGLSISAKLGEILGVGVGDEVGVEVREGDRPSYRLPVGQLVDDAFGLQAYMRAGDLHALLGQERAASVVYLSTDPLATGSVRRRLAEMPRIAGISRTEALIEAFNRQTGETMLVMTMIMTLFATVIAIGVVYNNARVALSMRSRDLASLRVLGFRRSEISAILLGEIAVQVAVAMPLGLVFGRWWSDAIMSSVDPEQYRLPIVISISTYAYALIVTAAAAVISALLVRRRLDHLDLIEVLKTRE